jgi:predicted phage-related endonuclease
MVPPEMTAKEISYIEPMMGSFIEADEETYNNLKAYQIAQAEKKTAEEKAESIKSEIVKKINDKESLIYAGQVVATFKMQSKTTLQTDLIKKEEPDVYNRYKKETSYRVLRLKVKE